MNCELITLEQTTALSVLACNDQVDRLIQSVRCEIESFNGTMETGVGRKAIITNANRARRANAALAKVIDDLIIKEKASIESVEQTIKTLRENKKRLATGLTGVYNDARQMVTEYENELKRIEDEKAQAAIRAEINKDHELALFMDEQFNIKRAEELAAQQEVERLRIEEENRLREIRDAEIARQAAEEATRLAEQRAAELAAKMERERLQALEDAKQAERDRIAAEERAKIQAEQAEKLRVQQQKDAEEKRLRDIETARQAEIDRQRREKEAEIAKQAQLEANKAHAAKIHNEILLAFIEKGVPEEFAKIAVIALAKKEIPHINSIQY